MECEREGTWEGDSKVSGMNKWNNDLLFLLKQGRL